MLTGHCLVLQQQQQQPSSHDVASGAEDRQTPTDSLFRCDWISLLVCASVEDITQTTKYNYSEVGMNSQKKEKVYARAKEREREVWLSCSPVWWAHWQQRTVLHDDRRNEGLVFAKKVVVMVALVKSVDWEIRRKGKCDCDSHWMRIIKWCRLIEVHMASLMRRVKSCK